MAHIVVFGNEKGGSGKTTTAMHTIIALLNLGFSVASIDVDERQQSLSRYVENRKRTKTQLNVELPLPEHFEISENASKTSKDDALKQFESLISEDLQKYDFIVIDTPGNNTPISSVAHSYADTIVTPINDSFIDLDLLGKVNTSEFDMVAPGIYSAMVFSQKLKKASSHRKEIDWIVVRNRLSPHDLINKRSIDLALRKMSQKLGFRIVPGFGDRVIFKELFLEGLTLLDANLVKKIRMTPSVISARQELRDFIGALKIHENNTPS